MLAAAGAIVLTVANSTYAAGLCGAPTIGLPAAPAGLVAAHGTGYRPTVHFVAVTADGQSVIVSADSGTVVRKLPKTLGAAVLSPDGNRVYGVWHNPKEFIGTPTATEHVSYIDLANNDVIVVPSKAAL